MSQAAESEHVANVEQGGRSGNEIISCPLCGRSMICEAQLREHVANSTGVVHRGYKIGGELEVIPKWRDEAELRSEYTENEKSQQTIADEWGCGRNTIYRWLKRHGIPRRDSTGGQAQNRVEYAYYRTETHGNGGYEKVGSYNSERNQMDWTSVHQLIAIANGADPSLVFSNGDFQCHHRSGIPWDNRPDNIELLTRSQHQRTHSTNEWTEEDGFPVLRPPNVPNPVKYHEMWGPGGNSLED